MKKRDEIDEIDDIELDDEVLDDEVIDDVVDDDFLEDEVEDVEEEKPSKKTKKANKGGKKSNKGLKIGLGIGIPAAFIALVLVALFVILPAIGITIIGGDNSVSVNASDAYTGTLGSTKPTATAGKSISSSMSAGEMCLAAVDNYYNADYVANMCMKGGVVTKVLFLNVNQVVQSMAVRIGKGSATDSTNSAKAKHYAYSKSFGIANLYEEYFSTGNNVTYRSAADLQTGEVNGFNTAAATSYNATVNYSSISDFIDATSTNFTKIWSYEVNKDTIKNYDDAVVYDKDQECYFFTISLDLEAATEAYKEVMAYQLHNNMKMTVNSLDFTKLELEFCVYDNGFIKYIYVHEAYEMNLTDVPVVGKISMEVNNNCMNEYSFNSEEAVPYIVLKDGALTSVDFDYNEVTGSF